MNRSSIEHLGSKTCSKCGLLKSLVDFYKVIYRGKLHFHSSCVSCMLNYRKKNGLKISKINRKYACKTKTRVLTYYGNGKLACVLCGFDKLEALSIDHIYGGGIKERRARRISSISFYRVLEKEGLPNGFRTLCMNCQWLEKARLHIFRKYNEELEINE